MMPLPAEIESLMLVAPGEENSAARATEEEAGWATSLSEQDL